MRPIDTKKLKEMLEEQEEGYTRAEPKEVTVNCETVKAYRCIGCRKVYINKLTAVRHMEKCVRNPFNRTCLTCMNRIMLHGNHRDEFDNHCMINDELIDEVRWYPDNHCYYEEDHDCVETKVDIVWGCDKHVYGTGHHFTDKTYDEAMEYLAKKGVVPPRD